MRTTPLEANLLFSDGADTLSQADATALTSLLERMGHTPDCVGRADGERLTFTFKTFTLRLSYRDAPIALRAFKGVAHTTENRAAQRTILRVMARHRANLTITVTDRHANEPVSAEIKHRVIWEAVDYMIAMTDPDLVVCPGQDRVMTAPEAAHWLDSLAAIQPQHRMNGHRPRTTRRDILVTEPDLSRRAMAWLLEPEFPAETIQAGKLSSMLSRVMPPAVEQVNATPIGRSALYVMSATIGLFALPLGASALAYNALSGGSMRLTGNFMAATGVFSAVDTTGATGGILKMVGLA